MSKECKCGESLKGKAIITFNNTSTIDVISNKPPICIEIFDKGTKINYASNWIKPQGKTENFDIVYGSQVTVSQGCTNENGNSYLILSNGFKPYFIGNQACGVSFDYFNCSVEVFDQTGFIRKQFGDCPITYKFACGDECPDGHIKCEYPGYPGYCCIPCQATASKIRNLAAKVGR
jgi:hypothetical protein